MDLILYNGNIFTVDEKVPRAEAVAVKGNKIAAVGTNREILALREPKTELIDLKGRTVVPGFNDSHMHLLNYAMTLEKADLTGCRSTGDLVKMVKNFIQEKGIPEGQWVQGRGWNDSLFEDKRMPTRHDLDLISQKHPVILTRVCGHLCVANTAALKEAGIFENPPEIEGGCIDKDKNGAPTGILRENARFILTNLIPRPDKNKIKELIKKAAGNFLKAGLTSVQTDDFPAIKGDYTDILDAYFELDSLKQLPIRVNEQVSLPTMEKLESFLESGYRTGYGSEFFKIGPLKLLSDGSLGGRTAALSEPYLDDCVEGNTGILIYLKEQLDALVGKAYINGMQVAVHAIGDRAMAMVLESYKKAALAHPKQDPRFRIVHCQITTPEIIDEFKKLNVVADIQPVFVSSDLSIVESRIGRERAKWTYNWKTLLEKGIHVGAGSDCPVEPFNPLIGIYAAVTRKNLDGYPENGWLPEQRLSVEQAVYIFTMGSAYCSFEENIKGSITPGKLADMAVLSEDIFTVDATYMKDIKVEMTVVDGKVLYAEF